MRYNGQTTLISGVQHNDLTLYVLRNDQHHESTQHLSAHMVTNIFFEMRKCKIYSILLVTFKYATQYY